MMICGASSQLQEWNEKSDIKEILAPCLNPFQFISICSEQKIRRRPSCLLEKCGSSFTTSSTKMTIKICIGQLKGVLMWRIANLQLTEISYLHLFMEFQHSIIKAFTSPESTSRSINQTIIQILIDNGKHKPYSFEVVFL